MKRNLSQLLQTPPVGGHSKEGYDLHNYETFHSKGAQLNVVSCRDTVPNSDYQISVDAMTRSMLCNTANFAQIKENWYIVHVPLALICNNAYQMVVQRYQSYSANISEIEQFPVFDLGGTVGLCLRKCYLKYPDDYLDEPDAFDIHGFNIYMGALRLLDMCGLGCYIDLAEYICAGEDTSDKEARASAVASFVETQLENILPSVARPAAYQCTWYNFFRNDIYDNDVTAECYNFDDVVRHVEGQDVNYCVTDVRGYKNYILKCLKLHYVQNKKDMFMGSLPGTQFGACATVPLQDNISFVLSGVTGTDENRWNPSPSTIDGASGAQVKYPSSNWHNDVNNLISSIGDKNLYHNHALNGSFDVSSGTPLFDVLTLVSSQAMQKWRQKSMLAGNQTIDQWRAHHGVVPRHLVDHRPDFIGSIDNLIHISEITSTANTLDVSEGLDNLGEIRGRGYGVSDKKTFKFHSDDYGVLLLLHSIVTENTYTSYGLEYGNRLIYYSDFFQQEFQNIGLEAVPKFLANTLCQNAFGLPAGHPDASQYQFLQQDSNHRNLFGMYAKYYGYKEYVDKVHGLFNPSRLIVPSSPTTEYDRFGYSDMESFVIPREDVMGNIQITLGDDGYEVNEGPLNFNLSRIYQNPRLFDSIFAVAADDNFDTDTFFTHVLFDVRALLPMTKLGLPDF